MPLDNNEIRRVKEYKLYCHWKLEPPPINYERRTQ